MGADFLMILHESTLFSRVCKPTSLGIVPCQVTAKASAHQTPWYVSRIRGSARKIRRRWHGQKSLIFMRFHEASFGNQHEIWSKQHNGKVTNFPLTQEDARSRMPFAFPHT